MFDLISKAHELTTSLITIDAFGSCEGMASRRQVVRHPGPGNEAYLDAWDPAATSDHDLWNSPAVGTIDNETTFEADLLPGAPSLCT
mmetsp:Transcript_75592/g.202380  ORF Transcript_75592/g.202380 Transcript_75592/m.202380 type:complete len:87 (-) Transcript_75592:230-490(-)